MSEPVVQMEKCPIPIIWLDTSVFIKLASLKLGQLKNDTEKSRLQVLHDRIYTLAREGKLLCPEASQPREIWTRRSDFLDEVSELSLGVTTYAHEIIEDAQVQHLMSAYIASKREITFPYAAAFLEHPVDALRKSLQSRFIVTVDMGLLGEVNNIRTHRAGIHREWEALRQRCIDERVTYERQLQRERRGGINVTISMARDCVTKTINGAEPTDPELRAHRNISRLIHIWDFLDGEPKGFHGLLEFIHSPNYMLAPSVDISAMLVAKLMVGEKAIDHGDAMDVAHISSMLPYADLMVVDRRMKNVVRNLDLDSKYNTIVCYIGDIDEIDAFFRKVEQSEPLLSRSLFE